MALLNDFFDSSDYIFSMDCRNSLPPLASDNNNITTMLSFEEQTFPFFGLKYEDESLFVPPRLGEIAEQPMMPVFNEFCGFQDQCNHFVQDFSPAYNNFQPVHSQSNSSSSTSMEEPSMKIRRYSEEERKDRITRYLNKRNRRNFNKTIKYACRKTLADRRIRVRGRFARNIDISHEYKETRDIKHSQYEEEYSDENAEIKHNGEDWLHEAVASLVYLPFFAGQ